MVEELIDKIIDKINTISNIETEEDKTCLNTTNKIIIIKIKDIINNSLTKTTNINLNHLKTMAMFNRIDNHQCK